MPTKQFSIFFILSFAFTLLLSLRTKVGSGVTKLYPTHEVRQQSSERSRGTDTLIPLKVVSRGWSLGNAEPQGRNYVDPEVNEVLSITAEEHLKVGELIDTALARLRNYQVNNMARLDDLGRFIRIRVAPNKEVANSIRSDFLGGIRETLGENRSYLYVAEARESLDKLLGSYGALPKNFMINVDKENGEYWFQEWVGDEGFQSLRQFRSKDIPERYAHLFEKGEGAGANE